jgi:hypothetical protein
MPWRRITLALAATALVGVCVALLSPVPALAATAHPIGGGSIFSSLGGLVGGVFSSIGHAVLGAFSWTISLAAKFILTTIAALVKLLIPASWVHKGLQIMQWIVAVPNYAGKITSPGGGTHYGFAGINELRDLFMWLGVAVAPLALVYATTRAMLGEREPVAIPVLRVLAVAGAVILYPYLWTQFAALADQVTHAILSLHAVSQGLYKLMDYAVGGVALGGWQLIDLGLMGAIALALLALIFLKVVIILLGALLYATGPLMIGLVATESGAALARAWASAVGMLLGLGIVWAAMFAVGALLIGDASSAGPLIAGHSDFGTLIGGLLLAVAGLASLWLCLKVAREAASLLRMQLAGLLAFSRRTRTSSSTAGSRASASRGRTTGQSLRDYGSRLARAAGAAGGELAAAVAAGGALQTGGRLVGQVGRRGILGTAAAGGGWGAGKVAPHAETLIGRSRAGAVAVRMARAGTAGWQAEPPGRRSGTRPHDAADKRAAGDAARTRNGRGAGADTRERRGTVAAVRDGKSDTRTPVGARPGAGRPGTSPGANGDGSRGATAASDSVRTARPASPPPRSSTRAGGSSRAPSRSGSSPPPARTPTAPRQAPAPKRSAPAPAPKPARQPAPQPAPSSSRDGGRTGTTSRPQRTPDRPRDRGGRGER